MCIAKESETDYLAALMATRHCGFIPGRGFDRDETEDRNDMDDSVQKSCWGVTAKAVIGFAGIMMLAWLFGGSEVVTVLASG